MSFKIQNGQIIPSIQSGNIQKNKPTGEFERLYLETIQKKNASVKVSAHAKERMNKREIILSEADMDKINQAVDTLDKKGAREGLLLYKDAAFIASVRNRTIITAMKDGEIETITNIDSFVKIK